MNKRKLKINEKKILIKDLCDISKDRLDIAHTKDGLHDSPLVVVVDEGLRLGVIGLEPLLDRLLCIILPLVEVGAAGIALAGHFWRIELDVICGPALAHPPARHPLDQLLVRYIDV
jgi:hypothetical protein